MPLPLPAQKLASFVPPKLADAAAQWALDAVLKEHPALVERLGEYASKRFAIVPTDMPFGFLISPAERRISARRPHLLKRADASISGPIIMLLALLEGRIDGDTAFFSRKLSIMGDTEAILALRNVLDDLKIDLVHEISARTGLLRPITHRLCGHLRETALRLDA